MTQMTLEEIQNTIRAARDSVWVIDTEVQKLNDGVAPNEEIVGLIERNVAHLKIVVAKQDILDSGQDISDLNAAIVLGENKLAEIS